MGGMQTRWFIKKAIRVLNFQQIRLTVQGILKLSGLEFDARSSLGPSGWIRGLSIHFDLACLHETPPGADAQLGQKVLKQLIQPSACLRVVDNPA